MPLIVKIFVENKTYTGILEMQKNNIGLRRGYY